MFTFLIMIAVSVGAIVIMIKAPSFRSAALIFAALPIAFIFVVALTVLTTYLKSIEPAQDGKPEFANTVACATGRSKRCCSREYTWNGFTCRLAVTQTKAATEIMP
jgi:hypothetical protein